MIPDPDLPALIRAVGWSYHPERPPPAGVEIEDVHSSGPLQSVLVGMVGLCVALVPGTNELVDAIREREPDPRRLGELLDLDAIPVSRAGHRVHAGAMHMADLLMRWRSLRRADLIVGHSLGGAAGLLAGWRVRRSVLAVAPFRPFFGEPPRMTATCLVDGSDAVTDLPPGDAWMVPGALRLLGPSGLGPFDAHGCENYALLVEGMARDGTA